MIFLFVLANVITASNTVLGFGKDDDNEDDDSTNLLPATATPSKKKGRFSDEEGQADLLENSNKASAKSLSIARLRKEPIAEVKKRGSCDASRWDF